MNPIQNLTLTMADADADGLKRIVAVELPCDFLDCPDGVFRATNSEEWTLFVRQWMAHFGTDLIPYPHWDELTLKANDRNFSRLLPKMEAEDAVRLFRKPPEPA